MKKTKYIENGTPYEWLDCATDLWYGAQSLWKNESKVQKLELDLENKKDPQFSHVITRPYFLLTSLCFENLLKGIIISENPNFLENGKLNQTLSTHNLQKLAKMAYSISLRANDWDLLEMATIAILSAGRYPISKSSQSEFRKLNLKDSIQKEITLLYESLSNCLLIKIEKGWNGPENIRMSPIYSPNVENIPENIKNIPLSDFLEKQRKVILKPYVKIKKS